MGKFSFHAEGKYCMPIVNGIDDIPEEIEAISFNYAMGISKKKRETELNYFDQSNISTLLHCFVDDAQFERVWNKPDKYIDIVNTFDYVCAPDFSMMVDMPEALKIFNCYRKQWVTAYWQSKGIKVIPTLCWADEQSFEYCLDGQPIESVVAIADSGTNKDKECRRMFLYGLERSLDHLRPTKVVFYTDKMRDDTQKVFDWYKVPVKRLFTFRTRFDTIRERAADEG